MRLSEEQLLGIRAFTKLLGATDGQASAVVAVLEHGNEKHDRNNDSTAWHIGRAMAHHDLFDDHEPERESGQPHFAHVVSRLTLAIDRILRGARCPGT